MLSFLKYAMVILVLAVLAGAAAQTGHGTVEETLTNMNYLPELLRMRSQSQGQLDMLQMGFYMKYDPEHSGQELSTAEQRFFKTYLSDVDYPLSFQQTVSNLLDCYRETGKIPKNGIELLKYVSGDNTFDPDVSRLVALGPDREASVYFKVFPAMFCLVNPATGTYIDSFEQKHWRSLGICVSELDEIPWHYCVDDGEGNSVLPENFTALRVRLYGESKDSVIYDHIVAEYTGIDSGDIW